MSVSRAALIDQIDALLPQTQCTKCGFDGCRPYANAIADGLADINRCPPGGQHGVGQIAALLQRTEPALDTNRGRHGPLLAAVIEEAHCIGCTLCIQACPVDAIVGANKQMHTVISELCTGCELCVPPCPVDCITMQEAGYEWTRDHAQAARSRHNSRNKRLQNAYSGESTLAARTLSNKARLADAASDDAGKRKDRIADALARARARRHVEDKNK